MYVAYLRTVFSIVNLTLHINSLFMIILMQTQIKQLFSEKKVMLVNLHISYDADESSTQ